MSEPDVIEFSYTPDHALIAAAQKACLRSMLTLNGKLIWSLLAIVHGVGAVILFLVVGQLIRAAIDGPDFLMYVLCLPFTVAYILLLRAFKKIMLKPAYIHGNKLNVRLSSEGMLVQDRHSRWQFAWRAVDAIAPFKRGLTVRIRDVHVPLPFSGLKTEIAARDVLPVLTRWRSAGMGEIPDAA